MLLYRLLVSIFALVVLVRAAVSGDWAALRARLGGTAPDRAQPHLWVHAASNGELASARPAIDALLAARPDRGLLITCNTPTAVALAQSWELPQVRACLAPLDLAWAVRRVLRRWQVTGLIVMEAEIWPHRVLLCPGPVVLLGARMTERTERGWARFPGLAQRLLQQMALIAPQDQASADRLRALGAPPDRLTAPANLKTLASASRVDLSQSPGFDRTNTWLAASTHAGEEELVAKAHHMARQTWPELRLILAPRHPIRATEIVQTLKTQGLTVAQRSLGQTPGPQDVYLADTMGEMDLWYAQTGLVFVGGSLVDKGGHTPFEPARFGCALIHGPHVTNFQPPYDDLAKAQAACKVQSASDLAQALLGLRDPVAQTTLGARAQDCLGADPQAQNVLGRLLKCLP